MEDNKDGNGNRAIGRRRTLALIGSFAATGVFGLAACKNDKPSTGRTSGTSPYSTSTTSPGRIPGMAWRTACPVPRC